MDYKKLYDKALELTRQKYEQARKDNNPIYCIYEEIFPELRESEDERIRKAIIKFFRDASNSKTMVVDSNTFAEWATYLEKQKENPKSADSIPADCVSLAKCEDRDSKYGVFPEDVIVVARACEKLEAHGYPELAHALKNVNLYTKPVDYEHEMWKNCEANFEGGKKEVIDHPEKYGLRKEQKLAECSRQSIIDALTKWLTEKISPLHKKSLDGTITEREEVFEAALLEMRSLVNSPDFQIGKDTSAEWSEEDEKRLNAVVELLENTSAIHPNYSHRKLIIWLKSLRPQPKQEWSGEDERILKGIIEKIDHDQTYGVSKDEMLNFLKKL